MNPIAALDHQPPALLSVQLLTVGVFFTAYLAAVTRLLETRGRLRAAWVAIAAGVGMGFVFTPWTLGALIAAGSVGAVGLFIGLSWLLSLALGVHDRSPVVEAAPQAEPLLAAAPELVVELALPEPAQPARATPRFGAPTAPAPLG